MKKFSKKKKLNASALLKIGTSAILAGTIVNAAIPFISITSYNKKNSDIFDIDTVYSSIDYWGGDERYITQAYNYTIFQESPLVTHFGINDRATVIGYSKNITEEHKQQIDYVVEYYNNLFNIINPNYRFKTTTCSKEECDIYIDYDELSPTINAYVTRTTNKHIPSKTESAVISINNSIEMDNATLRFCIAHEFMHIFYGSGDVDYKQSKTTSVYNYDDVGHIINEVNYADGTTINNESFVTLMPTDVGTLIAIYGDKNNQQKECEYIKLLEHTVDVCKSVFGQQPYFEQGYTIPDCNICK